MSRHYHPGVLIADVLTCPPEMFCRLAGTLHTGPADGPPVPLEQARARLEWELACGHTMLPLGPCDQWDETTGCQGHKEEP